MTKNPVSIDGSWEVKIIPLRMLQLMTISFQMFPGPVSDFGDLVTGHS